MVVRIRVTGLVELKDIPVLESREVEGGIEFSIHIATDDTLRQQVVALTEECDRLRAQHDPIPRG